MDNLYSKKEVRSKRLLTEAFFELLNDFPGKPITATDICVKADYARSTFYAHFDQIQDVPYYYYKTNWFYDYREQFRLLLQQGKPLEEIFHFTLKLYYQYWSTQKEIYKNLKSIGMDCIIEKLNQDIATEAFEKLHPMSESYINSIKGKCIIRGIASFSLVVYDVWVYSSIELDIDEMVSNYMSIIKDDMGLGEYRT